MHSILALTTLALAGTAAALPALQKRDPPTGAWCAGLGAGALDNIANFTLAAYNTTLPNANSTGAPLVLGQAGAVPGESFKVLSTYASYPFNDFPGLTLVNGGLIHDTEVSGYNITAGQPAGFVVTALNLPPPAQIYCGVASTSAQGGGTGFPQLAVFSDTESWSLCPDGPPGPFTQVNVIYKPTPDNSGEYVYESCYPVVLQIIED